MKRQELLDNIKEVLQRDNELTEDMYLDKIEEWDSLGIIVISELYEQLFSCIIPSEELIKCIKVSDLINLGEIDDEIQ